MVQKAKNNRCPNQVGWPGPQAAEDRFLADSRHRRAGKNRDQALTAKGLCQFSVASSVGVSESETKESVQGDVAEEDEPDNEQPE